MSSSHSPTNRPARSLLSGPGGSGPPASPARIVIFDVGNVLVRYDPGPALEALSRLTGRNKFVLRWSLLRAGIHKLRRGELGAQQFARRLGRRLGMEISVNDVINVWNRDLPGPVEGMEDLLAELQALPAVRVALLSDTNAFHWPHIEQAYGYVRRIEDQFLSFRERLAKDDVKFFQHAEAVLRRRLPTDPRPPLYFDDLQPNIDMARRAGWDAHVFTSAAAARKVLRERGIAVRGLEP